jgi:predicted RNA-binding Zn-ribbon protein involved in translation (DUF1610 family)
MSFHARWERLNLRNGIVRTLRGGWSRIACLKIGFLLGKIHSLFNDSEKMAKTYVISMHECAACKGQENVRRSEKKMELNKPLICPSCGERKLYYKQPEKEVR